MTNKSLILSAILIALMIILFIRDYVQRTRLSNLNAQVESLQTSLSQKDSELAESQAHQAAMKAESETAKSLGMAMDAIQVESKEINEAIHETVSNDEECADWYDSPVPDPVLSLLHDRLCDGSGDGHKD